jgi:hypothetical protein
MKYGAALLLVREKREVFDVVVLYTTRTLRLEGNVDGATLSVPRFEPVRERAPSELNRGAVYVTEFVQVHVLPLPDLSDHEVIDVPLDVLDELFCGSEPSNHTWRPPIRLTKNGPVKFT